MPEEGQIFKGVTKGHVPTQKGAERIIKGVCNKRYVLTKKGAERIIKSVCNKGYVLTQKAEDELFGWISMNMLCESS